MIDQNDLSTIKQIELEILDEFLRICNMYDLKYFLSGGTCLGAVRHQGFIPWDDDIDISMPREDYERFCSIAQDELDERFVLQNYFTEPNCGLVFGKIRRKGTLYSETYSAHLDMNQGVWIDLFPYDKVSDDAERRNKLYNKITFWKNLYIIRCGYRFPENRSVALKLAYYAAKAASILFSKTYLVKKIDKLCQQLNEGSDHYVIPYGGAHTLEQELIPVSMIEDYAEVEFEGRRCKTLANYKVYLTNLYGDYMKLPSENERKGGFHNMLEFKADWV